MKLNTVLALSSLVSAALLATPALSQEQPELDSRTNAKMLQENITPEKASVEDLKALIERALPKYDEGLLKPYKGRDPISELSFDRLANALQDKISLEAPKEVTNIDDGIRALRIDAERAKVGYVNRERSWNFDTDAKSKAIPAERAQQQVLSILNELGFDSREMAKPFVTKQMASGGKAGEEKPSSVMEMYRYVIIPRSLNGIPVSQSDVKVAINNYGEVQRISADWPQLTLREGQRLRDREAVINDVLLEVSEQDPTQAIHFIGNIQYAQQIDGDQISPLIVFNVNDYPTPYQVAVPLAEQATGDEKI